MNKNGFTILELMITIIVISTGVLGAYSVIQDILLSTAKSSNRLTATYLAQEGVESVRNGRDTNWIKGADWDDGLIVNPSVTFSVPDFPGYDITKKVELSGSELIVNIEVNWDIRGNTGTISVEERLYDWK